MRKKKLFTDREWKKWRREVFNSPGRKMKKVTVTLDEELAKWYEDSFETRSGGCGKILELYPAMIKYCLPRIAGRFNETELLALFDMLKGQVQSGNISAKKSLDYQLQDSIELEPEIFKKWSVNGHIIYEKIQDLSHADCYILTEWIERTWAKNSEFVFKLCEKMSMPLVYEILEFMTRSNEKMKIEEISEKYFQQASQMMLKDLLEADGDSYKMTNAAVIAYEEYLQKLK